MTLFITLLITLQLTLDSCIQQADRTNADLANAGLELRVARAQQGEALAAYFPVISANALGYYAVEPLFSLGIVDLMKSAGMKESLINEVRQTAADNNLDLAYHGFRRGITAGINLQQPLFAGGRIVTANRMARLGMDAARLKQRLTRRTTHQEIENAYWQIVAFDEKRATLAVIRTTLDTAARDLLSARRAGLATDNDLMQLRLRQGQLQSGMIELEQGIRLAKMNLLTEIGLDYTLLTSDTRLPYIDSVTFVRPDDILPASLPAPEAYDIDSLPEAQLMEIAVRAKELEKRMALGEALPEVAVMGTYRYINVNESGQGNAVAAIVVNVPITDWGKVSRQRQRIEAQAEIERNNRRHILAQLRLQMQQLLMNISTTASQLSIAEQNLALARDSYRIQQNNFRAGLIPMNELLQAQTNLVDATEQRTNALIAHRRAITEYTSRTK